MTRARTAPYGVVTPPPLDRWIEAVLMLCVSLVQGAATTLGMILNRNRRDWHTEDAHEVLPPGDVRHSNPEGIQPGRRDRPNGSGPLGPRPLRRQGSSPARSADVHQPRHKRADSCLPGPRPARGLSSLHPALRSNTRRWFRAHAQRACRNSGATRASVTSGCRTDARSSS